MLPLFKIKRDGNPTQHLMTRIIMADGVTARDARAAIKEQVAIRKAKFIAAAHERERVARLAGLSEEIVAKAKEFESMYLVLKEGGTGGYKPHYNGKTGEFRWPVSAVDMALQFQLQREGDGIKHGLFRSWLQFLYRLP